MTKDDAVDILMDWIECTLGQGKRCNFCRMEGVSWCDNMVLDAIKALKQEAQND
jgi:hypothetical protein